VPLTDILWEWYDRTPNGTEFSLNHTFTRPGYYFVNMTIQDSYGLSSSETILITAFPPLAVNAGPDELITLGYGDPCRTLTATASGGTTPYSYVWSTTEPTQSVTVSPTVPTTYSVTVTDANNQTAMDDVFVDVIDWRCGNNLNKIKVCHNAHTICISPNALQAHLDHGDIVGTCEVPKEGEASAIGSFSLDQNFPNPFNPSTTIRYSVPFDSYVLLRVFDLYGQEIHRFVDEEKIAGTYTTAFNGSQLPSGTYIYRLEAGGQQITKMMTLMK